jgi:hypothetical protein
MKEKNNNIGEETCNDHQGDFVVGKFHVVSYTEDEGCRCIERSGIIDIDISRPKRYMNNDNEYNVPMIQDYHTMSAM